MQISRISDAMLLNRQLSEAFDRNTDFAVNAFLNSPEADALKAVLTAKSWNGLKVEENGAFWNDNQMKTEKLFTQLHAANDHIKKAKTEIETLWQVRHDGLEEKLREIRQMYVRWSLQIANKLFVNSLLGKIVKDRFEDTPLNEFKSSPLFNQFVSTVPALTEAVELAGVQDRRLFDAADELNRLVVFSEWDKAYLLYQDVFPPSTNALCARLDRVIFLEKGIVKAQARSINLFIESIAPASETLMNSLESLTLMLLGKSE